MSVSREWRKGVQEMTESVIDIQQAMKIAEKYSYFRHLVESPLHFEYVVPLTQQYPRYD